MTTDIVNPKKRGALLIYDKREEQIANKQTPIFGEKAHTRVEATITAQQQIQNLPKRPYPFKEWAFRRISTDIAPIEPWLWRMLIDSARLRGFKRVIKALPENFSDPIDFAKENMFFPEDLISEKLVWHHWHWSLKQCGLTSWIDSAKADIESLN